MKRASLSVEWLEPAMIERNWTQEYVAEQMNVEVKTVQRWKRGENQPNPRYFYRLCKLFDRPLPPGFQMEDGTPDQGGEIQNIAREEGQNSLMASSQEAEDACSRFLASDLSLRLDRVMRTWFLRNVNARYHELPSLLIRELEQKDNTMQESPINRRNALRRLAAFPIELYSLSIAVPVLIHAPDEFLPRCAAGITACWYLRKGKDLAFASDIISRYIPTLKEITTNSKGTQRKDAAELLVQCLLLKATCVGLLYGNHAVSLQYRKQAETYSEQTGNIALSIAAMRAQAVSYDYTNNWVRAMQITTKAKDMIEATKVDKAPLPLMLQSYVYAGLAYYQAHTGPKYRQDALASIEQARAAFDVAVENKEAAPIWIGYDEGNLLLNGGLAYHHLGMSQKAIDSFATIGNLADSHETYRVESFIDQAMAEVNREDKQPDMAFCIDRWTQGIQGAIAMHSEEKFTLAIQVYAVMRAGWRGEQRIKQLSEQIEHW